MSAHPYLVFGDHGGNRETFYLPSTTDAERYARGLAMDLYRHRNQLLKAYLDPEFTVLVPFKDMRTLGMARDVDKGTVIGIPMQVVDGLDEPMLAYSLRRTEIPE